MGISAVRHIPFVDGDSCLVGLVSSNDLVASTGRKDEPELLARRAPPTGRSAARPCSARGAAGDLHSM